MGNPEVGRHSTCSYLTDHAVVVDIAYIELFDVLNRNNTNYTRGSDPPLV